MRAAAAPGALIHLSPGKPRPQLLHRPLGKTAALLRRSTRSYASVAMQALLSADGDGNGLRDHSIDPRYRLSIAEPVM